MMEVMNHDRKSTVFRRDADVTSPAVAAVAKPAVQASGAA
jgi:hypothetical protein